MALKVQLTNETLGSVTSDNAIGLDKLDIAIKRGKDNDGVMYGFTVELEFVKDLKAFINQVYESEGIRGLVNVVLYEYDENLYKWEAFYTGTIKLTNYSDGDITVKTNIDQTGLQIKFDNLSERDLDAETLKSQGGVDLPATDIIELPLHSKKLLVEYEAKPSNGDEFTQAAAIAYGVSDDFIEYKDGTAYFNIENGGGLLRDLKETSTYPWGVFPLSLFVGTSTGESTFPGPIYTAQEEGTIDIDIKLKLKAEIHATTANPLATVFSSCGINKLNNHEVNLWFEHRDKDDVVITKTKIGTDILSGCNGTDSNVGIFQIRTYQAGGVNISIGDKIYVYGAIRIYGNYNNAEDIFVVINHEVRLQADADLSYIRLSNGTIYPESNTRAVLAYEAMRKAAQYMTDKEDCFRSDVLGRPEIVEAGENPYATDGEAALLAITKGGAIRRLIEQTIFINWSDLFKSLSTCYNLSWGFEKTDTGVEVVRVEKREHFYKRDTMILDLGQVSGVKKDVAPEYYFVQAILAFPKVDVGQFNGLDEYNSSRTYGSPLTEVKNKQEIRSIYRASGTEIEYQRRLQSSKDSKLDDENFIIAVKRDGPDFRSERGSDFTFIDNVFDADSCYNVSISPSRSFARWLNVLAPSVVKGTDKNFTFRSGTANYKMRSQAPGEGAPLAEDRSFDLVGVVPLYIPETYNFTWKLTKPQFKLMQDEPYGYIRFRDEKNVICDGFILDVKRTPGENKGTFKLLRVFRL